MKRLVAILSALAGTAFGYPENVRLGYSCAACHVNGSGGGLVTQYGREAGYGPDGMATWSAPNEGGLLHGAFGDPDASPEWLLIGGDVRSINLNVNSDGVKSHRKFLMQADAELGVAPLNGLWVVASGGIYGERMAREYRRHYVKLDVGDSVSGRAGRFMPVYGLAFDDHTLASRQALGFDEGRETYAVEGTVRGKAGEVIVTQTFGDCGSMALGGAGDGYEYETRTETISLGKAGAFVTSTAQVGASYLRAIAQDVTREAWGAYAIVAPVRWAWLMADVNRLARTGAAPELVSTAIAGFEVYRGVNLSGTYERIGRAEPAQGAQLRLIPRPHFEVMGRIKRQGDTFVSLIMAHYNL